MYDNSVRLTSPPSTINPLRLCCSIDGGGGNSTARNSGGASAGGGGGGGGAGGTAGRFRLELLAAPAATSPSFGLSETGEVAADSLLPSPLRTTGNSVLMPLERAVLAPSCLRLISGQFAGTPSDLLRRSYMQSALGDTLTKWNTTGRWDQAGSRRWCERVSDAMVCVAALFHFATVKQIVSIVIDCFKPDSFKVRENQMFFKNAY